MNLPAIVRRTAAADRRTTEENAAWLQQRMSPYFFQAMADEEGALVSLAREMGTLRHNRRIILVDREKQLTLACVNQSGSLYNSLRRIGDRKISYAMFSRSNAPMPGMREELEVQRFEFDRRQDSEIDLTKQVDIPPVLLKKISAELRLSFPDFDLRKLERLLKILWLNNENYVRMSPPSRTAYLVWMLERGNSSCGLFLDVSEVREGGNETRILFAVGNPPEGDFLLQLLEIFNRLDLGVRRAYCQTISNGVHPYFLGAFYVVGRDEERLSPGGSLAALLTRELCTTQILATSSHVYHEFVVTGVMSGEDASLVNAFIAFCHTSLAHGQPERFGLEDVRKAFSDHPEMAQLLVRLFRTRFDPERTTDREEIYSAVLLETLEQVEGYDTGHHWLDNIRRAVYRCCLLLIMRTLKTNFFVVEKQALAFRLDPAYLRDMGQEFTSDLPDTLPFRVTFFFSRAGYGYHIGFSDIARGGWRTVIARSADDFITATNTIFREVYVLAHTQHLKNKDIYEGGSKMALVLDASDLGRSTEQVEIWRLYKLQYGIANAFLDIFVTRDGQVKNPRVLDYYGDDEPIEIGPDENMHDAMIETIAGLSMKRGYILGIGIMSSKRVGINHKEYGVTSTGVVKFAEITMADVTGIDITRDPFILKMTGGPNGDVAGNCLRIMLRRCPLMQVRLILDGTAALFDPNGIQREELGRIVLAHDLDAFNPEFLGVGGFIIHRTGHRMEGLKETHRKISRTPDGLVEEWLDIDNFYREYNSLVFKVKTDLFIPAGGRPETIDGRSWRSFLDERRVPTSRVIVEGANSFITPEARVQLQKSGVVIMRDASANKCGVISSSYEIIANLLLSEEEFLKHKEQYVGDVLAILEKRAADEARLILRRRRESGNSLLCTEISDAISLEINNYYSRLFTFFTSRPELCLKPPFRQALLNHLPRMLREVPAFRRRVRKLPRKYLYAILAAEIGSSLVYSGDRQADFEDMVRRHLTRVL